jgi:hypothetical protein
LDGQPLHRRHFFAMLFLNVLSPSNLRFEAIDVRAIRYSIMSLLGFVAMAAPGCTALANPLPATVVAVTTIAYGVLLLSVLLSIYSRPPGRAFWVGFCVLGWGYGLLIALDVDNLATSASVDALCEHVLGGQSRLATRTFTVDEWVSQPREAPSVHEARRNFTSIGELIWCLLLAFAGGILARVLHERRERVRSHSAGPKALE